MGAGPGAGEGDNSNTVLNKTAQEALKGFFRRLEDLDDESEAVKEAVKQVSVEMKAAGFKAPPVRKLVALRRKDKEKIMEANALMALYAHALGCEDLV